MLRIYRKRIRPAAYCINKVVVKAWRQRICFDTWDTDSVVTSASIMSKSPSEIESFIHDGLSLEDVLKFAVREKA